MIAQHSARCFAGTLGAQLQGLSVALQESRRLTPLQADVFAAVPREGGLSSRDIVRNTGISPGSVHPTLAMLAKKGLLRRETVPGKVLYFRTGVEGEVK